MDLPFVRCSEAECRARQEGLNQLLRSARHVRDPNAVVLPFVDASKIETRQDCDTVVRVLTEALPVARDTRIDDCIL